ncbi:MAG: 50S ribosomal protein L9 [Gammaproteobacteria bacterium]|nr:50S ribosomal protein L9 [Gammaproteobacteria bacterium]
MEVMLLEQVQNLGEIGDVVRVRSGYARNFLIPHGKASAATKENKARLEEHRKELEAAEAERLNEARRRAALLENRSLEIKRKVAEPEEGKLFGSVTAADIADTVNAAVANGNLERSEINLGEGPLKTTGEYKISVFLHPEVHIELAVNVVAEQGME